MIAKRVSFLGGILLILSFIVLAGSGYAHNGEKHGESGHHKTDKHDSKAASGQHGTEHNAAASHNDGTAHGSGHHGGGHHAELTRVVVADTKTTNHLNLYVAKELGLFEKHHIDLSILDADDDDAARQLVLEGHADVFWSDPALTIKAVADGLPLRAIAQGKNSCSSVLIVRENSPIKTLEDLNHKIIAAASPTCETALTLSLAAKEKGSQIHFQKLTGENAIKALESGKVEGAILEEPYASIAELHGYKSLFHDVYANISCCTINASDRLLTDNAGILKHFIMAIDEANALIAANPTMDNIVSIAARYTGAPKDAIIHGNSRLSFVSAIDRKGLNLLGDELIKAGVIKNNPGEKLFAEAFKGITW
jgi:NitT/TauT family transport system substrate-binding protein